MGRPPLYMITTHLNLPQDLLDRMDAIVGPKGRSKFARQAIGQLLDRMAPVHQRLGTDPFEHDGGHEPRMSAAGTAALLDVIRARGFDAVMHELGFSDPAKFLHMLLGHSPLPNQTVTLVAKMLSWHRE